jgi:hypothetical protein
MRLIIIVISVFAVLSDTPCKSGCICDTGTAKNVKDIWLNNSAALCGNPAGMCEVCSICNNNYPNCACCNPTFGDADSCLNCRLRPENYVDCGSPTVSYKCDPLYGQCIPETAGGGKYPDKSRCVAECKATPYNCKNQGHGQQVRRFQV